jgi:hypothetical protein
LETKQKICSFIFPTWYRTNFFNDEPLGPQHCPHVAGYQRSDDYSALPFITK